MKKVIKNLDCKLFTKDDSGIQESGSVKGLFLFSFLEANERNNLGMNSFKGKSLLENTLQM